jgi:hypothetical protein
MDGLRGAKVIASALLVATGGLCMGLGNPRDGAGQVIGLIFLAVGVPMLISQWRKPKVAAPAQDEFDVPIDTGFKASKDLEI